MRQKNTVYHLEVHNQFQETPDQIKKSKWEKAEHTKRDEKQGQSKYQVNKETKKSV
jgi:hypothetical protein